MSKIEEITEDSPEIQKVADAGAESDSEGEEDLASGSADSLQSRSEKKARKLISKLGLKKIAGINRVTLRRPKNVRPNPVLRIMDMQRLMDGANLARFSL